MRGYRARNSDNRKRSTRVAKSKVGKICSESTLSVPAREGSREAVLYQRIEQDARTAEARRVGAHSRGFDEERGHSPMARFV